MRNLQGVDGTERKMYVKELKERLEHDNYVIDAHLVAEAMLRRAAARRADGAPPVSRGGARDRAASAQSRRPRG